MFKFFNNRKFTNILLILVIALFCMGAVKEYRRSTNLRVKGWLFGDTTWSGLETVANVAAVDTVVVAGIDTTCYVFITAIDITPKAPLYANISRNGDSIFVTCDSTLAVTNKYNWMVIRP